MYSSDPLYPNNFYQQQDFIINSDQSIKEDNINPPCILIGETNVFKCYHTGIHTLTLESNQSINFKILERKRTYRWSFSIFERTHDSISNTPTLFIEQGKNYTLRIWVTSLSFNSDIQKELRCNSKTISPKSANITLSFYSLGEYPIVTFTEFNEYDAGPAIFNYQGSYWDVEFTVSNLFLRTLTIKGHDNSDFFDIVSDVSFNFQYKSIVPDSSSFFSPSSSIKGQIQSIDKIPCYPNFAIATVLNPDNSKQFFYTNDNFNSIYEFGKGRKFSFAYLTINGIYYIDGQKLKKIDNSGDHDLGVTFSSNDPPIGFFSSDHCDFYLSYNDQISYENRFIGVYSSKKIVFSYDGTFFRENDFINTLDLNFISVSYKWQSLTILATDKKSDNSKEILEDDEQSQNEPFIVNYDIQNHVASRMNLPFNVENGKVKFCSDYGFLVAGNNLLFSPDTRSISSIFLPGHFENNKASYITSFVQKGQEFVLSASDKTVFCGDYANSNAVQLFDNPNDGYLILDSQNNIVSVGINSQRNGFTTVPIMHFIEEEVLSYSKIVNGELTPRYLDSSDTVVTNLTIMTVSNYEPSILIMPPKNAIFSFSLFSQSTTCSNLVTVIDQNFSITSSLKSTSEFCMTYYISTRTLHLSSLSLASRRGEGGEEGSNSLQIFLYSNGKVFDVYNVPLVFGCSPKRRLGIKIGKKICYPNDKGEGCVVTVYYNRFFKPIPLIFDDQDYVKEATFDYALLSTTPLHYSMTVGGAGCKAKPQTYEVMGENWSRSTYKSCFSSGDESDEKLDDSARNKQYTILNLTNNEVKIKDRESEFIEIKLINLGSSSTMCQLEYTFRVKVLEKPIQPGFIALIVIIGCIIVANIMFYEYWQYIMFMYPEAIYEIVITNNAEKMKSEEFQELNSDSSRIGEHPQNLNENIHKDSSIGELDVNTDTNEAIAKQGQDVNGAPKGESEVQKVNTENNSSAGKSDPNSGLQDSNLTTQPGGTQEEDTDYSDDQEQKQEPEPKQAKKPKKGKKRKVKIVKKKKRRKIAKETPIVDENGDEDSSTADKNDDDNDDGYELGDISDEGEVNEKNAKNAKRKFDNNDSEAELDTFTPTTELDNEEPPPRIPNHHKKDHDTDTNDDLIQSSDEDQ